MFVVSDYADDCGAVGKAKPEDVHSIMHRT